MRCWLPRLWIKKRRGVSGPHGRIPYGRLSKKAANTLRSWMDGGECEKSTGRRGLSCASIRVARRRYGLRTSSFQLLAIASPDGANVLFSPTPGADQDLSAPSPPSRPRLQQELSSACTCAPRSRPAVTKLGDG